MSTVEIENFKQERPSHGYVLWRILALSLPIMVGSLAVAGMQITKAGILSFSGAEQALFTLSQVQPGFIFMLAFMESLAIANQVFSSKSVNGWPKRDVLRSTRALSILGVILALFFTMLILGVDFFFAETLPPSAAILPEIAFFILSLIPYMLFELRNAALRGQGKTLLALLPFAVLIIIDLAVTYVGIVHYQLGFQAVLIGNAVGPLVALPLVSILLRRVVSDGDAGDAKNFRKHLIGMVIGVAVPVFFSLFAGSASAIVIFPALSKLGADLSSGFLILIRIRILFIIPAVAVGSAIAIQINQMPERGFGRQKRQLLLVGVLSILAVYGMITAGVFLRGDLLVNMVVPLENAGLHSTTLQMLTALVATFFLIAAGTMLQVILEHLGRGVQVLVTIVLAEAITIGAVFWAMTQPDRLDSILLVMNGTALLAFILFSGIFIRLIQRIGGDHAV